MVDSSSLIITILPLAGAAAVSPVALSIFLIIMSLSDDPKLPGLSFYLGAIIVLLVTVFIGIFLGHKLTSGGAANPTTMAAIDMSLGAILVLLGFRNFVSKKENNLFKYLTIEKNASAFSSFKKYFSLGSIAFLTNFSTAIFLLAAGRVIGIADAGFTDDTLAILTLAIITLLVIEIPLLFFLILPGEAKKVTEPVNEWISTHGNLVTGAFCVGIGLLIIYNGMVKLGLT
ncbi:MAG TPA: GAP family protein [Methanobacterium sp.]|nr:GAP family protein [Methanobacterium sp.]